MVSSVNSHTNAAKSGGTCGILTQDLPLGYLQGGRGSHRGAPSDPSVHRTANGVPLVTDRASAKILRASQLNFTDASG